MDELLSRVLVKQHLRIVHDDDDAYLQQLCDAALFSFNRFTGHRLVAPGTPAADLAEHDCWLTPDITQGALMLIGHWYENRELAGERNLTELPSATHDLWSPYVIFHLGDSHDPLPADSAGQPESP